MIGGTGCWDAYTCRGTGDAANWAALRGKVWIPGEARFRRSQ
jgi:hypothetical protein